MKFFASLLTVAFIVLKLVGVIDWSWFIVALPLIIYIVYWLTLVVALVVFTVIDERAKHRR
jgi:hypothetical protein